MRKYILIGHIIATAVEESAHGTQTPKQLTLEEDLVLMENMEGNWDDFNNGDEEDKMAL